MSVLRAVNAASRWISKKRGASTARDSDRTAGLNRSVWPTITIRPCSFAVRLIESASSRLVASGFSTSTSMPSRSNCSATSLWNAVGTATLAAWTRPTSAEASVHRFATVFRGDGPGPLDVAVGHADQPHSGHGRVEPGMVPPQVSHADDPDLQQSVPHAVPLAQRQTPRSLERTNSTK